MNLRVFYLTRRGISDGYQEENRNGLAVISPIGEEMTARPFRCFDYQLAFLP